MTIHEIVISERQHLFLKSDRLVALLTHFIGRKMYSLSVRLSFYPQTFRKVRLKLIGYEIEIIFGPSNEWILGY